MNVISTDLDGVLIIEPKVFGDKRGFFVETFSADRYCKAGIKETFVQDNVSSSSYGVLRGLHFQNPNGQGKLVQVLVGEVFDVAVDIRKGSPTFGKWVSVVLSADNHKQFYVPPNFAHGFCVLSKEAIFSYKCTDYYDQPSEGGIIYNDPDLAIDWPVSEPIISDKDKVYTKLSDIDSAKLPVYGGLR